MIKMEQFKNRHIGVNEIDRQKMLETLGLTNIEELISQTIPSNIRLAESLEYKFLYID